MTAPRSSRSLELVSLAKRMGYLQALRFAMVGIVLLASLLAGEVTQGSFAQLGPASIAYAVLSAGVEWLRRRGKERLLPALSALLLVDGIFLAWVIASTGTATSPLLFLVFVHVVAVSLLASYRTGLKLAIWHSLLFLVAHYVALAGLGVTDGAADSSLAALNLTALWLVTAVTAAFSSLNERELRRGRRDIEALATMAHEMELVATASEASEVLLQRVTEALGFRRGVVIGRGSGALSLLAASAGAFTQPPKTDGNATLDRTWETRQPVLVRRLDPAMDPMLAAALPDASNVVVVPMFAEGEPLGALVLERGAGASRIERRVVLMAEQFAAHGALALRNAWLLERVQSLAETDPLTGVANRRTFEIALERDLAHAERSGEPVSLAMFDLDHFKRHNDLHGHQRGDEVLRRAGEALRQQSRTFDTVARYGGEEFAVVMPGLAPREALAAVERLRTAIAESGEELGVTASAGVATFPANARDGEMLLRAADECLYESKAAGRDRATRSRRRGGLHSVAGRPRRAAGS